MDTRTDEVFNAMELEQRMARAIKANPNINAGQRFIPISINGLSKKNQEKLRNTGRVQIGKNAKCPCGSGRRFKRCCMKG